MQLLHAPSRNSVANQSPAAAGRLAGTSVAAGTNSTRESSKLIRKTSHPLADRVPEGMRAYYS
jgi:hypothetical protein